MLFWFGHSFVNSQHSWCQTVVHICKEDCLDSGVEVVAHHTLTACPGQGPGERTQEITGNHVEKKCFVRLLLVSTHHNSVTVHNTIESVCDYEHCAVFEVVSQDVLNHLICSVEMRTSFFVTSSHIMRLRYTNVLHVLPKGCK